MMLVELQSQTCTACATGALKYPHSRFRFAAGQTPHSVFGDLSDGAAAKPLMHPSRVSWPTSVPARIEMRTLLIPNPSACMAPMHGLRDLAEPNEPIYSDRSGDMDEIWWLSSYLLHTDQIFDDVVAMIARHRGGLTQQRG